MAKVDLHVHSKYSSHASEWFLKRLGAHESYTEPEEVYRRAKDNGMRFVTLTDHNKIAGALWLKQKYPDDVITGMEATAYFPEDGCKVHILIYGLDQANFEAIEQIRHNIYELRDYLRDQDLAYSVAHATYSVNDRLTPAHLEKLILLFDVFEGINGSRDKLGNRGWMDILRHLTPSYLDRLRQKHGLEPISDDPWIKGLTAGSDDHAALFIGKTYTTAGAATPEEFIQCLKNKVMMAGGRHNNYQTFAFTIYKIAYDFSKTKNAGLSNSLFTQLNEVLFNNKKTGLADHLKFKAWKTSNEQDESIKRALMDIFNQMKSGPEKDFEEKVRLVYEKLSRISDTYIKVLFESLEKDLRQGDVLKLVRDVSSLLPGIFFSLPFFTSLKHMFKSRTMINRLRAEVGIPTDKIPKRILWFTDTISDMNGVAETIKKAGWITHHHKMEVTIAAALNQDELTSDLPPNLMPLPYSLSRQMPYYEHLGLRLPSVLKAMEMIYQADPEAIIISTPGPVGLLGLLAAKLLNLRCMGIYHTDFTAQTLALTGEEDLGKLVESYMKWFYASMDYVKVPAVAYMDILEERGLDPRKLAYYRKGIDTSIFTPEVSFGKTLDSMLAFPDQPVLMYVGRISKDKNLDFLLDVFQALRAEGRTLNLVLVGDGPQMDYFRKKAEGLAGVILIGRQPHTSLPTIYTQADVFVFPSLTDTFGMAVLEAQACGVPAVVSNTGGPKEIVLHQQSGLICPANHLTNWVEGIKLLLGLKEKNPEVFRSYRQRARQNAVDFYDWEKVIRDLFTFPQDQPAFTAGPRVVPFHERPLTHAS